ncbi:unnamed protein product [Rotaria sp. Silwood1]|nr:unnamed protein product [Rotaria sp. Silwood1]
MNGFTRTPSSAISLNQQSKNDLFHTNDENDIMTHIGCEENISISDSEPLAPAILLDVSLNEQKQLLGELSFVLV